MHNTNPWRKGETSNKGFPNRGSAITLDYANKQGNRHLHISVNNSVVSCFAAYLGKLLTESCQSLFCPLCVFSLHFNLHPALLLNVCNGADQILARKNILIQINLTIFLDTHITLKDTSVMEAQYLAV